MNHREAHIKNKLVRMKIVYLAIALLLAGAVGGNVRAQNAQLKKGDKLYERMVYPGAVRQYERGLSKGQELRAMERVADAYEQLSDTKNAERWYAEVVKMKGSAPINKLRYGQMLKANGKYSDARKWFEAYLQTGENPALAARMVESCDFAMEGKLDSLRYKISPEPCNTKGSEFGPVLFQQGFILVGERKSAGHKYVNMRNNNGFYDLYYAERDPKAKSGVKVKRIKGKVNRKYHEGPAAVNRDQSRLYFTRSNYVKDKKGKTPSNHSKLRILYADYSAGKWKYVREMPFNSDNYSCGHPALSADGQIMVFASDIPGGFGGTDLYICRKEGEAWTTPQNLGSSVNTEGDEQFPYLHASGDLFFASTGHAGFGGFDIYAAPKEGDKWGKAVNAGYGVNSPSDDFSIAWIPGKSMGYFASNRGGDDNIYQFKRQMKINGTIVDKRTGKPLEGVMVSVLDASNKEIKYMTDAQGMFIHFAEWGKDYLVTATMKDYLQLRERLSTSEISPMEDLNRQLQLEHDLVLTVSGQVTDAASKAPLPGATVRVIGDKEKSMTTDAQGNYFTEVDPEKEYAVVIRKPGFVPQVYNFSTEGKKVSEDFTFNAPLTQGVGVLVEGKTVEMESKAPLSQVHVRTINLRDGEEVRAALSRKDGRFWQVVNVKQEPTLIASKIGYFSSRLELEGVDSTTQDTTIIAEIGMVPYEVGALVKVIYYEYNKSDLRKNATKDLLEIVYFLQDNPEASVELSSFTDSRGGNAYNEALSQRRADAAVGFIVSKRIEKGRVTAKGYGETKLVNKCSDNVECTDEEHSANRRTEIRITKLASGTN